MKMGEEKELKKTIEKGESEILEFKESLSIKEEIGETTSAFSNAKGGRIFVGVSDSGKIIGTEIGKKTIEGLANFIKQNTDNHAYPKITVGNADKKNVIIIGVSEADEKPVFFKGKAYKRVGRSNHKLSASEIRKLAKESGKKVYWDGEICEGASLDDIDWKFVKRFIKEYEELNKKKVVSSEKNLLNTLKCIKNNKPTNAGILLFGKNPCKFFPRHYVTIVRYPGKDIGSAYLEIRDIEGNLFNQIDGAEGYINKHIESLYRLKEGQAARERIQQYPAFVIRELIANAVAHRDYSISGSRIIIKMFKDSIEFDSPGGFAGDVNEKNILEMQFSRNPIIVKVLNKARYVEELGEGWNRIIDEIKSHPLKPKLPKIKGNGNVKVRLFSPGMEIETKIEPIISQLNERQKKSLQFLKEHNGITTKDYIAINNVSERTARYDLADMVNKEIFQKVGKTQAAYYIIRQTSGKHPAKKVMKR